MNLANRITISRILLIPFFLIAILYGFPALALIIYIIAGISDALDGFIARTRGQRTTLGTFLDPLADKLLITTCFIIFTMPYEHFSQSLPLWLTIIVISRDIMITLGALVIYINTGRVHINPSFTGKITTCLQFAIIFFILLANAIKKELIFLNPFYILTGIFTVSSGIQYIFQGTKQLSENGNKTLQKEDR